MTEKEYRSLPGISRSELWRLRESPEKFKWAQDHPQEPTPALIFGQLIHKLLLEPETFNDEFIVAPIVDRRTKDGKEEWANFEAQSEGKTIVKDEMYCVAEDMVSMALSEPFVKKLLDGVHEKPFFWVDDLTGEKCKCRLDAFTRVDDKPIIVDYKTTADASTESFMRSAINYGYDFQSGMYCEGVEKVTGQKPLFVFIAQEKTPPYAVNIMQADELMVKRGYDIFRELIGTYHACKESGNWWGYLGAYNVINNLNLPAWLAKEVE